MPQGASELLTARQAKRQRGRRRGRLGRPNPIDPRDPSGYAEQLVEGGASSRFAPSHVNLPEAWIGPEPVGEAMAERLSVEQGLLLSGRSGVGVPYGIQGSSVDTETSYMVQPQDFWGPTQMGSTTRVIEGFEPAFPNARVPEALLFEDVFNPWSSIS